VSLARDFAAAIPTKGEIHCSHCSHHPMKAETTLKLNMGNRRRRPKGQRHSQQPLTTTNQDKSRVAGRNGCQPYPVDHSTISTVKQQLQEERAELAKRIKQSSWALTILNFLYFLNEVGRPVIYDKIWWYSLKDQLALTILKFLYFLNEVSRPFIYDKTLWDPLKDQLYGSLRRAGSMISLPWHLGVDRVSKVIALMPNVTASEVSMALILLGDAAFVCAFAWSVYLAPCLQLGTGC